MVTWIIEASTMRNGADALEKAIVDQGGVCHWLDVKEEARAEYGSAPYKDEPVVFIGSFEAASRFQSYHPIFPGVIGDFDEFRCSHYYPVLGYQMLNEEYVFIPKGDLKRRWIELRSKFTTPHMFLRPDLGSKAFTGQLVSDYDAFIKRESCYFDEMPKHEMCLIAQPQNIRREWRFVVMNGKVITGSQYKLGNKRVIDTPTSDACYYAGAVAAKSDLPLAYMLDIAEVDDGCGTLRVMEINNFNCSDFYGCDPYLIVGAMHEMIEYLQGPLFE